MTKDQLLTQLKEEILKVWALPGEGPAFIMPDTYLDGTRRRIE